MEQPEPQKTAIFKPATPQNSGEIVVRDDSGRFAKGHSKLGGKQKGCRHLSTILHESLLEIKRKDNLDYSEALVRMMIHMAINEGNVKIIKMIWEYLEGKPGQAVKIKPLHADTTTQLPIERYDIELERLSMRIDKLFESGLIK